MSGVGGSIWGSSLFSLARMLESKHIRAGRYHQPYLFCSRSGSFVEQGHCGERGMNEYLPAHPFGRGFLAEVQGGECR